MVRKRRFDFTRGDFSDDTISNRPRKKRKLLSKNNRYTAEEDEAIIQHILSSDISENYTLSGSLFWKNLHDSQLIKGRSAFSLKKRWTKHIVKKLDDYCLPKNVLKKMCHFIDLRHHSKGGFRMQAGNYIYVNKRGVILDTTIRPTDSMCWVCRQDLIRRTPRSLLKFTFSIQEKNSNSKKLSKLHYDDKVVGYDCYMLLYGVAKSERVISKIASWTGFAVAPIRNLCEQLSGKILDVLWWLWFGFTYRGEKPWSQQEDVRIMKELGQLNPLDGRSLRSVEERSNYLRYVLF